ncbi:hypothetical protein WV31_12995 [Magnetospirillum sp. ME-1]|uniref:phosphotransferase n=1 Tax=Magnetospirillum sp. ME-1 TaxID=1639348 RepID=UPI000A17D2D7|nr:phosphotransferase [Magnetospirillum sp. ME-1]ARJ66519.1 hypothetical protein WV31_12995 [Magnetospirillum sp. ME-1]
MDERLAAIAAQLLGRPVVRVEAGRAGGNNRIVRVEDADGGLHALKFYPPQAEDPRDRLGAEFEALSFLWRRGERAIPQPIARAPADNCALYAWVEGEPPAATPDSVGHLAHFLARIQEFASHPEAAALRSASASVFAAAEVITQLRTRRARLDDPLARTPDLDRFLADGFDPLAARLTAAAVNGYERAGLSVDAPLTSGQRVLSPSDFGFHNALSGPGGRLAFVDFEYFGWDDPVKAAADVMLHPGMDLSPALGRDFLAGVEPTFSRRDECFITRLGLLYPLFALIWCLIVLNEFLPERWARRAAAGAGDRIEAQARQLAKARTRLDLIRETNDRNPVFP